MKTGELEQLAREGKLVLHEYSQDKIRTRYIYGKEHTSNDIDKDEWYKIQGVKKIPYRQVKRYAMMKGTNHGWKILKADYMKLYQIIHDIEV